MLTPLLSLALFFQSPTIMVTREEAEEIAVKVWRNECAGTIQGLTSWNVGEDFASLGIGHFIWYSPKNTNEPFQETFPELLRFIESQGFELPVWLQGSPSCPWTSRDEFMADIDSEQMTALRQFLFDTKHLQAIFIAKRIDNALPQMLEGLNCRDQQHIIAVFWRLSETPSGLFCLMDYINFKGLGISAKESYKGNAWGLRQVLLRIPSNTETPIEAFKESAKEILTERVNNAPPERNEGRWLKGWCNRINLY